MKKNLIKLGVMLAATFSLTNCTEEITTAPTPEVESRPYTIFANAPETKTVNDGLSTKWAENDALNVVHAPAGTHELSYNTKFTLADADIHSVVFSGNNSEPVAGSISIAMSAAIKRTILGAGVTRPF